MQLHLSVSDEGFLTFMCEGGNARVYESCNMSENTVCVLHPPSRALALHMCTLSRIVSANDKSRAPREQRAKKRVQHERPALPYARDGWLPSPHRMHGNGTL